MLWTYKEFSIRWTSDNRNYLLATKSFLWFLKNLRDYWKSERKKSKWSWKYWKKSKICGVCRWKKWKYFWRCVSKKHENCLVILTNAWIYKDCGYRGWSACGCIFLINIPKSLITVKCIYLKPRDRLNAYFYDFNSYSPDINLNGHFFLYIYSIIINYNFTEVHWKIYIFSFEIKKIFTLSKTVTIYWKKTMLV